MHALHGMGASALGQGEQPMTWKPGDMAVVSGHCVFSDREMHGRIVRVEQVHEYPSSVLPSGAIAEARVFDGWYSDREPAFGTLVPFDVAELSPLGACEECGASAEELCRWQCTGRPEQDA